MLQPTPLTRPIFVLGAGRSGTTLVQRMLGSHPRISAPNGESQYIIPLLRREHEFGDLRQAANVRRVLEEMRRISREFVEEDLSGIRFDSERLSQALVAEGRDTMLSIIVGLYEMDARARGKQRWLDKTPYYVLHIPTLKQHFPDAQFVHVVRDGRDVALSALQRKRDLKVFNLYTAAKVWQQYVQAGDAHGRSLGAGIYHMLRFEDLLADPEGEMRRVCAFLGEAFDETVVHFVPSTDPKSKTPLLAGSLRADNKEKWRRKMTPHMVRVFEAAAGETLERHGYPLDTAARRLPLPLRVWYRAHNELMRRYYRLLPQSA